LITAIAILFFCDTLDRAYEYAQVMSSLDFDKCQIEQKLKRHTRQYTRRTSFGANGILDKFVKEDLQQPHRNKISFEGGSKDIKISLESYKLN
jgi:hypothetical protein